MPGTTPPTSQLEWLSSTTAMIVLFWSKATRDLLRSFGWGIAALHRENAATKLPFLAARPIASIGPAEKGTAVERSPAADHRRLAGRPVLNNPIQLIGPASLVGNSRETLPQERDRWFESGSLHPASPANSASARRPCCAFRRPSTAFHSVSSRLPLSGAAHDFEENGIVGRVAHTGSATSNSSAATTATTTDSSLSGRRGSGRWPRVQLRRSLDGNITAVGIR